MPMMWGYLPDTTQEGTAGPITYLIAHLRAKYASVNCAAVQQSDAVSESICSGQTSGEAGGHAWAASMKVRELAAKACKMMNQQGWCNHDK